MAALYILFFIGVAVAFITLVSVTLYLVRRWSRNNAPTRRDRAQERRINKIVKKYHDSLEKDK